MEKLTKDLFCRQKVLVSQIFNTLVKQTDLTFQKQALS